MEENIENYTEISAEEFLKLVGYEFAPKYKIIKDKITFRFIDLLRIEHLSIDSVIFNDAVNIELDSDTYAQMPEDRMRTYGYKPADFNEEKIKINFTNCIFDKGILIQNVVIKSLYFEKSKISEDVLFIENSSISNLSLRRSFFKMVALANNVIKDFVIYSCNCGLDIFGERTTFLDTFQVKGGYFESLIIHEGVFKENVSFVYGVFKHFQIVNGIFEKNIRFGFSLGEYFDKPLFLEKIGINGNFEEIEFYDGIFNGGIVFQPSIAVKKMVSLIGGIFLCDTIFIGGNYGILLFRFDSNCFINNIILKYSPNTKYIYFEKSEGFFNKLTFENAGIIGGTLIKISDIPINNITFNNSVNAGNIIFSGVKSKKLEGNFPTLKIHNSDLGKTTFIDCDFEEMKLDFKSSKITEVFLAGTKMPKDITTDDNEQKRLGYGQLKKIYDNRGDTVTANEYFAKEMNVLYSQTKWSDVPFWKNPIKCLWRFSREKTTLFFNKISSNHGTSWGRAFWNTVGFAGSFYWLYCLSLGIYPASPANWDKWENFGEYMSYFIEFVNPFHKADFIAENLKLEVNSWTRVIDGGSRVVNSYFIYQLIQAFRKHRRGS